MGVHDGQGAVPHATAWLYQACGWPAMCRPDRVPYQLPSYPPVSRAHGELSRHLKEGTTPGV